MSSALTLPQEQQDSCAQENLQQSRAPQNAAPKKLRLHCPILLLCERRDMAEFLGVYMRYLFQEGVQLPNLQLINLGSFKELPKFLRYVEEREELTKLAKIRVLCDAGPSVPQRQKELARIKNSSFLQGFTDYQYFLFPGKLKNNFWTKGYLEDALVQALQPNTAENADLHNLVSVTQDFLLAVQACRGSKEALTNYNRHVLHAYLAGTERYVGFSVGEAAKGGAFALGCDVFASLRKLLEEL